MEKDINELKRLFYSDGLTQYGKRKLINHYEQQIQELKEIEQIHRQENGDLRERVKELEEENERLKGKIDVCNWQEKSCRDIIDEKYISVSLVKEKIEEYFEDEEWLVEHDLRALCDDEKECREYYTNKKIALKDIKKAILDKIDKLLKNY